MTRLLTSVSVIAILFSSTVLASAQQQIQDANDKSVTQQTDPIQATQSTEPVDDNVVQKADTRTVKGIASNGDDSNTHRDLSNSSIIKNLTNSDSSKNQTDDNTSDISISQKQRPKKFENSGNHFPDYALVKTVTEDVSIRQYQPTNWVSVSMSSYDFKPADEKGFNKLKEYIDGANEEKTQVFMNTPVLMRVFPALGKWTFTESIFLSNNASDPLPRPTDTFTHIKTLPEMKVAVKRFSNQINARSTDLMKQVQRVIDVLGTEGIGYNKESYFVAQYNRDSPSAESPSNEVWLILSDDSSDDSLSNGTKPTTDGNATKPPTLSSDSGSMVSTSTGIAESPSDSDTEQESTSGSNNNTQQSASRSDQTPQSASGTDDQSNSLAAEGSSQNQPAGSQQMQPTKSIQQTQPQQDDDKDAGSDSGMASGVAATQSPTQVQTTRTQPADSRKNAPKDAPSVSLTPNVAGGLDPTLAGQSQTQDGSTSDTQQPEVSQHASQGATNSVDEEDPIHPPTPVDQPASAPVNAPNGASTVAVVGVETPPTHAQEGEIGVEPAGRIDPSEHRLNSTAEHKQVEERNSLSVLPVAGKPIEPIPPVEGTSGQGVSGQAEGEAVGSGESGQGESAAVAPQELSGIEGQSSLESGAAVNGTAAMPVESASEAVEGSTAAAESISAANGSGQPEQSQTTQTIEQTAKKDEVVASEVKTEKSRVEDSKRKEENKDDIKDDNKKI